MRRICGVKKTIERRMKKKPLKIVQPYMANDRMVKKIYGSLVEGRRKRNRM